MSGRSTFSGTSFQSEVGACVAGLLLTERPLSRLGENLPGTPQKIYLEVPSGGVDDIVVVTEVGQTYIQAKNTVPLSDKASGELASVATQFVRQFQTGVLENGTRRDLAPALDRLVLAVGNDATNTVTRDLREVLDRNRTGAATGLPDKLQHALDVFTGLLAQAWLTEVKSVITPTEQQALLALCSVIVVGSAEHQLATDALLSVVAPGLEGTLLDLLDKWANQAARQGTGGDAAAIRLALNGKIQLTEPPSFRDDIARLTAYSTATLADLVRFTTIEVQEGFIAVVRPVVNQVADTARNGHLAITGEPGAGKSAILYAVAQMLGQQHPVFCFKVQNGPGTLDELRRDIGLSHSLIEVLGQVPGIKPAYLLLDALDASRGNQAETTYRNLLHQVAALPGWYVVASVRTFDLRIGKEWQRLFSGQPPIAQHMDSSLSRVRHLHIGLLDTDERADLARQSPTLHAALIAGGPKMEALALNPFNLALLADLLRSGTPPEALAGVGTRGQLLELYWQERVGETTPIIVGLTRLVAQMLENKVLTIPQGIIEAATAEAVDALQGNGVLLLEQPRRALGFRHHVLFDYAVACLALLPDQASAKAQLSKERGAGLLIAPSLDYWVDGLKHSSGLSKPEFWEFMALLVADEDIDPIVRVEVGRLAIETVEADEDLTGLLRVFNQQDATASRCLRHLLVSLAIKSESRQPFAVGPWAHLVADLQLLDDQLGFFQVLLGTLLDSNPDAEATNLLGTAARRLLTRIMATETLTRWLAKLVIPHVIRTYCTDPGASGQLLARILEPERFRHFGHFEVPALAKHILTVAAHEEELLVKLTYCAFGPHDFSHEQATTMVQSNILAMTSNAAQDFNMATHEVERSFQVLLANQPRTALRVLAAALRGARDRRDPSSTDPQLVNLTVQGVAYAFEDDGSTYWAWDLETNRSDDHAEMYQHYMKWIAGAQAPALLADIPSLLLKNTGIGIVWRTLFEAGAKQPQVLGIELWQAASNPMVLQSLSTRKSAIELLQILYPLVAATERQEAERAWLAWDFADYKEPERMRTLVIGTVLQALNSQLTTDEARAFLLAAVASGQPLTNEKPCDVQSTIVERVEDEEAVDEQSTADLVSVVSLGRAMQQALAAVNVSATGETLRHLHESLMAFDTAIDRHDTQDGEAASFPEAGAAELLAKGLGVLLAHEPDAATKHPTAITRLLELTYHPEPTLHANTEEYFAQSAIWSYSCARIDAAQALANLVESPKLWPLVKNRFEHLLLHDPHPAVRTVVANSLYKLSWHEAEAAWQLAAKFADHESNPQVIRYVTPFIQQFAHQDTARFEPLVLKLLARVRATDDKTGDFVKLLVGFALERQLAASAAQLQEWIADYPTHEKPLLHMVRALRAYLAIGYGYQEPSADATRQRAQKLMQQLVTTVEPAVRAWSNDNHQPTAAEEVAHQLFNELAGQLFYAVGYDVPECIRPVKVMRQCLIEYAPFISQFAMLGTPVTVHHMLDILHKFVAADPPRCFDLFTEAMLRKTGVARYEYESQGAGRFVELISEYLADYRPLFAAEDRRTKLINCLAVFSDAGWPEARRLFQQLPDLFR